MLPNLDKVKAVVRRGKNFLLTTHVNPDGDGLGSEIALANFLRKMDKQATIVNHSKTPANYEFLDPEKEIVQFAPERDRDKILKADVIIIVDTNQTERLRSMEPFVESSSAEKIVIDHHLDPGNFPAHYLIDEDSTATGEIVYKLLVELDDTLFDKTIAQSLYTAIMTDTGSFRYPRTDAETHAIASKLIEYGAEPTEIFSRVYESWSPGHMRLLGMALTAMQTTYDGKLAYLVCTQNMFKETDTSEVDTDNFASYPMSVQGVLIGVLINELPNGTKISFRSKGDIPVNELAKEFGGGGHKNAAGARLHNVSLEDTIKMVTEKTRKYLKP